MNYFLFFMLLWMIPIVIFSQADTDWLHYGNDAGGQRFANNPRRCCVFSTNSSPWKLRPRNRFPSPMGIGLHTVMSRLERRYNDQHQFSLQNQTNGGLRIEIKFPAHD